MEYIQKDFSGGLNTIVGDTRISENQYYWGINVRPRFGRTKPVEKHVLLNAPEGEKQGIISLGTFLIIFVAGNAYYRQDGTTVWIKIPQFSMRVSGEYWTQVVPSSTFNFVRKVDADGNVKAPIVASADSKVSGTYAGVVVQDGYTQPFLIVFDDVNNIMTSRRLKTFNEWSNDDLEQKEYVPIGKQMLFLNQILFVVAPDGKSVYRSITGRPLDFMVNVDTEGHKLENELKGGAATVSFAFDFDRITCLSNLNIPDSFVYGTAKNTRILTLDYNNTLFGEPSVRESAKISSGILNQYSFVELIGDYAMINANTVISFDAVQTLKFKGRNSIFSLPLQNYTKDIKQTRSCATIFDNYALFNIDTNFGNAVAVFDLLRDCWVSFDITDVIEIKQFTTLDNGTEEKLYCITMYDEVFEMFSHETDVYLAEVTTRSHVCDETQVEHKSEYFRAMFNSSSETGDYTVLEFVDNILSQKAVQPIMGGYGGVNYPVEPPVIPNNRNIVDNPAFNLSKGHRGKKIFQIIRWNKKCDLVEYTFRSQEFKSSSSSKQQAKVAKDTYAANS